VHTDRTDVVAERLTGQIRELSQSLGRAGVSLEERSRLLELAALAAIQAVCLDASSVQAYEQPAPTPVTKIADAPSLRDVAA
jgi:hypothetical protein